MTCVNRCIAAAILFFATSALAVDAKQATAIMATPNFGSAYVTLTSPTDDTLLRLTSPCCDAVELHSMTMSNGTMQMRKLDQLALAAGVPVAITGEHGMDDSMHLMLIGIHTPMKPGATFPVTFYFATQKPLTARFTVVERSTKMGH